MIEERDAGRTVTSTLVAAGAEDVKMGIAEDATAHIMDLMSKGLYGDAETAVIREYSTNALDAHIEEGVSRPIEVTTPVGTFSDPYLTIEDFGTGLTREDIRTIYSQYGASTKRATNDQVGMLGLGCKSGFALGDQFTVVSTKDGMTITVSIERDEQGTGVMRVVSEQRTDKPSGTKVIIPVAPRSGVADKAYRLFRFWQPGTVLLNGAEPQRISGIKLTDELLVIEGEQSYVVMGNVPYPAEIQHGLPRGYNHGGYITPRSIAAFVPIGSVSFPPSRESLRVNATNTKATIARIEADVDRELQGAVQREIERAATPAEAIRSYLKHARDLGQESGTYTYKGAALPKKWEPISKLSVSDGNGGDSEPVMLLTDNSDYKMSKAHEVSFLASHQFASTLVVYGYDKRGMTPSQKRKLMMYVNEVQTSSYIFSRFALVAKRPDREMRAWLGDDHIIDWATIDALKLPVKNGSGGNNLYGRLPGSYDFYQGLTTSEAATKLATSTSYDKDQPYSWLSGVAGDQIDQSKPVYYVHGGMSEAAVYIQVLAEHHAATGCYVVALSANRIPKFKRNVPTTKRAVDGVQEAWAFASKGMTPADRLALHVLDEGAAADLKELDETILKDPDLVAAIRIAKTDVSAWYKRRQKYGRFVDTNTLSAVTWSNPLEKYPLFEAFSTGYSYRVKKSDVGGKYGADMHLYLNAKYAQIKGA